MEKNYGFEIQVHEVLKNRYNILGNIFNSDKLNNQTQKSHQLLVSDA